MHHAQQHPLGNGHIIMLAGMMLLALALGLVQAAARIPATVSAIQYEQPALLPPPPAPAAPAFGKRDLKCLASAIWYEAGNQKLEGRIAVAEVVIARAKSGRYPSRLCAVVAQRRQFSFVTNGIIPAVPERHAEEIADIARGVAEGRLQSRVRGALWYHATYVSPNWDLSRIWRIGRIGAHIFYADRTS